MQLSNFRAGIQLMSATFPICFFGNSGFAERLMIVCLATCLTGCSGLITDSATTSLLHDHSLLSNQKLSKEQAESTKTLDDLTAIDPEQTDVAISKPEPVETSRSQHEPDNQRFRFSDNMPEEPDFESYHQDIQPSESSVASAETAKPGKIDTQANVKLVAITQPIDSQHATYLPLADSKTNPIASSLQPITDAKSDSVVKRDPETDFAWGLPSLSNSDRDHLRQCAVETPSMSSAESVDLSDLELESNISDSAFQRDAKELTKPLDAAQHLSETIRLLEATSDKITMHGDTRGVEITTRLLNLLRKKVNSISSTNWDLSTEEHDYWQQQLEAVSIMLEPAGSDQSKETSSVRHQSASEAIEHLDQAANHLRSIAGLKLHGGQLCSRISGFGQFVELKSNHFQTGDRALVYIAVENQHSARNVDIQSTSPKDSSPWLTRLRASYAIRDSNGKEVANYTYPAIEDLARQRRRDFYLHLPLTIPDLNPGDYDLLISVKDLGNANSARLPSVRFSIAHETH